MVWITEVLLAVVEFEESTSSRNSSEIKSLCNHCKIKDSWYTPPTSIGESTKIEINGLVRASFITCRWSIDRINSISWLRELCVEQISLPGLSSYCSSRASSPDASQKSSNTLKFPYDPPRRLNNFVLGSIPLSSSCPRSGRLPNENGEGRFDHATNTCFN